MESLDNRNADPSLRRAAEKDKRMELTEHLGELRSRIMRAFLYLVLGATLAWFFFKPLYGLIYRPLEKEIKRQNVERTRALHHDAQRDPQRENVLVLPVAQHDPPSKEDYDKLAAAVQWVWEHPTAIPLMSIVFKNFHEPFMVRLKLSIVYGFILVLPLVIWELAMFVTPALTPQERKPLRILIPISIFLLTFGVMVAYFTMFYAMRWFLSYLDDFPQPAALMQDPNDYVLFFVKMMAAFGIAFQLPVVLMGGAFAGIVTSKGLLKHWRWGIVIAAAGGLFTPSNDLISMALMSIPLLILYFASVVLVKWVEMLKARQKPA